MFTCWIAAAPRKPETASWSASGEHGDEVAQRRLHCHYGKGTGAALLGYLVYQGRLAEPDACHTTWSWLHSVPGGGLDE